MAVTIGKTTEIDVLTSEIDAKTPKNDTKTLGNYAIRAINSMTPAATETLHH